MHVRRKPCATTSAAAEPHDAFRTFGKTRTHAKPECIRGTVHQLTRLEASYRCGLITVRIAGHRGEGSFDCARYDLGVGNALGLPEVRIRPAVVLCRFTLPPGA